MQLDDDLDALVKACLETSSKGDYVDALATVPPDRWREFVLAIKPRLNFHGNRHLPHFDWKRIEISREIQHRGVRI